METLIIHPKNKEQRNALEIILKAMKVPFEAKNDEKSLYNSAFVEKMRESRQQAMEGKTEKINLEDLWK